MEKLIADVTGVKFDMENALEQQLGAINLPFPGMDKSTASVCIPYSKGQCPRGPYCPFRHIRGDRTIVCKHWLRGLCKKGDQCEFLHEYDMTKMPECYFYARFNACHNKECPFLHIDPESKIRDCPWYDRGFCRHGPTCRHRHVRRVLCMNYASGFCPDGPNCKFMHPRFELPPMPEDIKPGGKKSVIVCHYCGESGHKALQCPKMPCEAREVLMRPHDMMPSHGGGYGPHGGGGDHRGGMGGGYPHEHRGRDRGERGPPRPLEEVTCFKCGDKGHYANKCPKGHLAFLSQGGGGPRR